MSKYIYWVKKQTYLGVLDRENHDKANKTCLKEGEGIEMSTTLLPLRDAPLSSLKYLPLICDLICERFCPFLLPFLLLLLLPLVLLLLPP